MGGGHGSEGGGARVHQLDGLGHDFGGLSILGNTAQLILPEIQVTFGQGVQIGGLRHGIKHPFIVAQLAAIIAPIIGTGGRAGNISLRCNIFRARVRLSWELREPER